MITKRRSVWGLRVVAAFAGFVALALFQSPPSHAQGGAASSKQEVRRLLDSGRLTKAQVDALLAKLTDAELRSLLLDFLKARAASQRRDASVFDQFEKNVAALRVNVPKAFQALGSVWPAFGTGWNRLTEPGWLLVLLALVVAFFAGIIAECLVRRAGRRSREALLARINSGELKDPLSACFYIALLEGIGVLVFAVVTAAVFMGWMGSEPGPLTFFRNFFLAVVAIRFGFVIGRMMFAPGEPGLRNPSLTQEAAKRLHDSFVQMVAFIAIAMALFSYLGVNGLDPFARGLVSSIVAVFAAVLIARFIWHFRAPVSAGIIRRYAEGDEKPPFRIAVFADSWHWLAIAYVVLVLLIGCFKALSAADDIGDAAVYSLLLLPGLILIDKAIARITGGRAEGDAPRRRSVARNVARFVLIIFGVVLFFRFWGFDLFSGMRTSLGPVLARAVIEIGVIVLIAYLVWEMFRSWFDKKIEEEMASQKQDDEEEADGPGGAGLSRLATLLPIVKAFVTVTFFVIAGLTLLQSMGVDIGPLLAGAGIIGLAIGFGSQTLVKDIVAGVFFLIDDAFRVGEYVESGSLKGSVERLGIRSVRLRHHRGMVHTIPYGELSAVTNYSRDWVIMKLEFRLPYGTDMEKVRKAIKKTGQEMAAEELFAGKMLAPLKSQGVVRTEQSALVFRAKFTAKPGEQFLIRREAFRRIQEALAASGIELFARHQVEVRVAEENKEQSGSGRTAAAAAAGAVTGGIAGASLPADPADQP